MDLAIAFTNLGPYHLARLHALNRRLRADGGRLFAYQMASCERKYPWEAGALGETFDVETLFPGRSVEDIPASACASAMTAALDRDRPDAVAIVGYSRPESMAGLRWAEARDRPAVLLSESQEIDHPRVWWKEAAKRIRVRRFASALVGGPRHRDYLGKLGMPGDRVAMGYDAVDNDFWSRASDRVRASGEPRPEGLPERYFLAVSRFVPEKNLIRLVHAFACYRADADPGRAFDLVLCGSGPTRPEIESLSRHLGLKASVHLPGFLGGERLASCYAHASAFVHPSRMEPWGLVANEAAACGLPLLISDRAGCVETLVPESPLTGRRIDPDDVEGMASALAWMAGLEPEGRRELGLSAREVVSGWGPERFASGMMEALALAAPGPARRRSARVVEAIS